MSYDQALLVGALGALVLLPIAVLVSKIDNKGLLTFALLIFFAAVAGAATVFIR